MSGEKSQFTRLVELGFRVAAHWKRMTLFALIVGVVLGLAAYYVPPPSYTCEVLVYLQPQPWSGETAGRIDLEQEIVFTPKPFSAYLSRPPEAKDYVQIMTSDGVLGDVLDRFVERHGDDYREKEIPTRQRLRRTISAYAPTVLRTPTQVEHTPTIYLSTKAPKPEMAYQLMVIYLEVVEEWTRELTYAERAKKAFASVEAEYNRLLGELDALDAERIALARENAEKLEAVQHEWSRKAAEYEAETERLALEVMREWSERIAAAPEGVAREAAREERDQAIEALRAERRYGLEDILRAGEGAYSALRRECEIAEQKLERRYRMELEITQNVAAALTRAAPVIAEEFEEIVVMNEPRMPEKPEKPSVVLFVAGGVVLCGLASLAYVIGKVLVGDVRASLDRA